MGIDWKIPQTLDLSVNMRVRYIDNNGSYKADTNIDIWVEYWLLPIVDILSVQHYFTVTGYNTLQLLPPPRFLSEATASPHTSEYSK